MRHYGVVSSSIFVFVFFTIFTNLSYAKSQTTECSRRCIAEDCDRASIRYGKYCGLGYSGCAGEKPCDDADACCQIHDDCVGKHGMMNVSCHKRFKRCIKKVAKTGKPGFSKDCPYDLALRTMLNGMDMAILLGDMGLKLEL